MGGRRLTQMAVEFKVIARRAAAVFGGTAKVMRYKDDAEVNWVDVLGCADRPSPGVTAYATIGLSRYDNQLTSGSRPLRVELLGACASKVQTFAGMLASCAFNIASGEYSLDAGRDLSRHRVDVRTRRQHEAHAVCAAVPLGRGADRNHR